VARTYAPSRIFSQTVRHPKVFLRNKFAGLRSPRSNRNAFHAGRCIIVT
jgi:hypothetical protein